MTPDNARKSAASRQVISNEVICVANVEMDVPYDTKHHSIMALEGSYGDGSVEIVVQTFGAGCFVFTVPGSAENNLFWPTGRGNYLRNGRPWTDTVRDCPADLDENNDVDRHDLTLFADNFNSDGNDLAAFAADLGQNAYP